MDLYPLLMTPHYAIRPWGGRRMHDLLGKPIPDGPVGESWEVSTHPHGLSRIANGPLQGQSLHDVVARHGADLLGRATYDQYGSAFPLLVKLIDVHSLSSVQVHPNDEQAVRLEGGGTGKTEAWYIIDRAPDAVFYCGLQPGVTRQTLRDAVAQGTVEPLLRRVDPQPGDCLFVPPGTVHATGQGVFMLEVQQCSDLTYRLYDWDRTAADGSRRELHTDKALEVIAYDARPAPCRAPARPNCLSPIVSCASFAMYEAVVTRQWALPEADRFLTGTVIEGQAVLSAGDTSLSLARGDSVLVPAHTPVTIAASHCRLIVATPGDPSTSLAG